MNESILISILIIFIYIFIFFNRQKSIYIENNTGAKYLVYNDNLKKQKSQLLSELVVILFKLRKHLKQNVNVMSKYKDHIEQLNENFSEEKTVIYETDPESELTSYSVNKGEELSFCLKSKNNGELHDINLLMYVAVHEVAHIACPEIGHGLLFKKIFRKFLKEAIVIGLYKKVNYEENPVEYCGMILSSSIL